MKKIVGIYKITNIINGKSYIGLSKNCMRRWYDHRSKAFNSHKKDDLEKPLYKAFRKYGLENFTFEILEECLEEDLAKKEIFFIEKEGTYKKGYNANLGGDLGLSKEKALRGENHKNSKLTEQDVIFCRECFKDGLRSKDIWEKYYKNKITFSGFQNMWHGRTWKHIKPETFDNKLYTRKKVSDKLIKEILQFYSNHPNYNEVARHFKGRVGYGTIYNICSTNGEQTYSPRK